MNEFLSTVGSFFSDMFVYTLAAVFLENTIFSRGIGTSTALYGVRKKFKILPFGLVITAIITASSLAAYFIKPYIMLNKYYYYILPPVYVVIIGIVYIAALIIIHRMPKNVRDNTLPLIHVSAFNCAVLGALLIATNVRDISLAGFLGFGIGSGIGFTMATACVFVGYERLSGTDTPRAFRGFPITLIYIGIISVAIYGIIGHELPF